MLQFSKYKLSLGQTISAFQCDRSACGTIQGRCKRLRKRGFPHFNTQGCRIPYRQFTGVNDPVLRLPLYKTQEINKFYFLTSANKTLDQRTQKFIKSLCSSCLISDPLPLHSQGDFLVHKTKLICASCFFTCCSFFQEQPCSSSSHGSLLILQSQLPMRFL